MSFIENLTRPLVSFAEGTVKTIEKDVVNSTVSFAEGAAKTIQEDVVNPTVSFAEGAVKTIEKDVVNPTVSFAESTVKTIEEDVVNLTVSFAKGTVKTIEEDVVNPTASLIESQFQRLQDVHEQQEALQNLQDSSGSKFSGDDYRPSDRKIWMANLTLEKLTLNKIVWPGTHDSATNEIGIPLITRPLAECQTHSIYEQLVLGTRVLDIRVQENRQICHGILTSYDVDIVINDIRFLSETHSEIVILEIRTEFGRKDPPEFETYLTDKLGQFLIHQDDNLFNKPVSEILPKRVICIWKPRESPKPKRGGLLWNSDYLKDNWIDTDLPWTKFQSNLKHLSEQQPISSRKFFYRVENTVTPQADNPVVWVKPVTDRIRKHARLFISQCVSKGCGDKLQILSTDFIDFACVGFTHARVEGKV